MKYTRIAALILAAALLGGLLAGCFGESAATPAPAESAAPPSAAATPVPAEPAPGQDVRPTVNLAMLKGPTGIGSAKLLADNDAGTTANHYAVTMAAAPNELVGKLTSGELDIAALPTNLAATLYQKNSGEVQMLALNTLGVLYILAREDSGITSLADLAGKTVYATGQGANPEYILSFLLWESGLEPGVDVTIVWGEAEEVSARLLTEEDAVAMLPIPAATAVLARAADAEAGGRIVAAVDLNQAWDETTNYGAMAMGCVVARREFAEEHPELVDAFLAEYGASIAAVSGDPSAAAPLVAQYQIVANEGIAKAAIPAANLTFITGAEMRDTIQDYFEVLYQANPASIGGAQPDDAFYYIANG